MTTQKNRLPVTCGEYLAEQRNDLSQIRNLGAPGAIERAGELLARIYAVSYQMNFERMHPPAEQAEHPAEQDPLDRELVEGMAARLSRGSRAFQDIVGDPWKLSQAVFSAQQGNGFPLIEMVNVAHLALTARVRKNNPEGRPLPQEKSAPEEALSQRQERPG